MMKLLVLLQITAATRYDKHPPTHRSAHRDQRGSVTMEHVVWAVAVIAIAGIVVAAVTGYVTSNAAKIK